MNTCATCKNGRKNIGLVLMCYRPKKLQSGKVLRPGEYGFSIPFEIDAHAQEGRADTDACGPDLLHWEAK